MKVFNIFLIIILLIPYIYTETINSSEQSNSTHIENDNINNSLSSNITIPNLKYDSTRKIFTLYGIGLGNSNFTSKYPELEWKYNNQTGEFTSIWTKDNKELNEFIVIEINSKDYFLSTNENHNPEIKTVRKDGRELLIQGRFFSYNISDIRITSDGETCDIKKATFGFIECTMSNPQIFQLNSAAQMIISGKRGTPFRVDFIGSEPHFGNKQNNNGLSIKYLTINSFLFKLIFSIIILSFLILL